MSTEIKGSDLTLEANMKKNTALVDYADELLKDQSRAEKIKRTKKQKQIEQHIAVAILQNNPKRAIEIAELHNIPSQEFGKMVAKYSSMVGAV